MKNFIKQLDLPDYLFLLGVAMLYSGLSMLFGHPIALSVVGAIFILFAAWFAVKGAK